MEAQETYRFERISPDADAIRREAFLLRTVFPQASHYTDDFLTWEYVANPDGHVVGYDAYLGDELCAHYATQPLTATLFGRSARGLLSFNTATHPNHQGHGLFTKLARRTFDDAAREGYEFVVGVANQNSTPGFTRKLGFQLVAPLQVFVGIGAPYTAESAVDFARTWTPASRTWRTASPRTRYVSAANRVACATGTPLIKALLTARAWDGALVSSPAFALAHPFSVWMGLAPSIRWRGISVPLPGRLRPSPLNLIFLDLTGQGRTLDAHRVAFDAIDFDAF